MEQDSESKETTSRRDFTKAVITAAVAAPIAAALASCTKEPPQNNSSGQATPPVQPSPTPKFVDEGTPITVGGGGGNLKDDQTVEPNVSCRFREDAEGFPEEPGSPGGGKKEFKNKKGWKITTFKIRKDGAWTDHSKILPSNGKCTVTIFCVGTHTGVTIEGGILGIEMDTDKYQKQTDGYYRNPDPDQYIQRVIVTGGGQKLFDETFSKSNECKVCTNHAKPDEARCTP